MFRIHDHALTESELYLFETTATVGPDGYISLKGRSRREERAAFNLCEILLEWSNKENFGVQRIRIGTDKPLTKARWASRLFRPRKKEKSLHDAAVWSRKISVRACFPQERIEFRILGWRLMNVSFLKPNNMIRVAQVREARITRVMVACSEQSTSHRGAKPR